MKNIWAKLTHIDQDTIFKLVEQILDVNTNPLFSKSKSQVVYLFIVCYS